MLTGFKLSNQHIHPWCTPEFLAPCNIFTSGTSCCIETQGTAHHHKKKNHGQNFPSPLWLPQYMVDGVYFLPKISLYHYIVPFYVHQCLSACVLSWPFTSRILFETFYFFGKLDFQILCGIKLMVTGARTLEGAGWKIFTNFLKLALHLWNFVRKLLFSERLI